MSDRMSLTIAQAAEAAGVSTRTLRRRLHDGSFPGAKRGDAPSDPWMIPVEDLLAAGFRLNTSGPEGEAQAPAGLYAGALELQQKVASLEAELAVERARREGAEDLLAEVRAHLATAQAMSRALGAGTTEGPASTPEGTTERPRRRLWSRRP